MKEIAKCRVCACKIPMLIHLFYNESSGLECRSCHSLLAHSGKLVAIKYSLMMVFVIFFAQREYILWIFPAVISLALLIWIQLTAEFNVRYENKNK